MSQWWRAVGNTVSDLTGPRFEPQTSRSRDERVTARPTNFLLLNNCSACLIYLLTLLQLHTLELSMLFCFNSIGTLQIMLFKNKM